LVRIVRQATLQAVQRLVRLQWRRLCLAYLWNLAKRPCAWAALVFLSAGLIHQGIREIDPVVPILASVPALTWLLWALRRLPGPNEAAARADRRLQAESLFVSVWELASASGRAPAVAPLLIGRARQRLQQWQERLAAQPYPRPGMTLLFSLSLVTLGGFLLLIPGRSPAPPSSPDLLGHHDLRAPEPRDPVALIHELRQQQLHQPAQAQAAMATASPTDTEAAQAQIEPASATADQGLGDQRRSQTTEIATPAETPPATALEAGTTGDTVKTNQSRMPQRHSDTPGTQPADPRTAQVSQATGWQPRQYLEFAIPGLSPDEAYDSRQAASLITTRGVQSRQSQPQAMGEIATQAQIRSLSPQHQTLVRDYFNQLSQMHESRP
jgi:hypothetical protein